MHFTSSKMRSLLALSLIDNIGNVTISKLLSAFNSAEAIFEAGIPELMSAAAIPPAKARKIREFNDWGRVDSEMEKAANSGVRIMTLFDKDYPGQLRQLDTPPAILYLRGSLLEEDRFSLAMVGSRLMSAYGRKIARDLAHDLASSGLTIVSGMARGIDTVSHTGALKAGGRSIAVLGCGVDICYPPENKELMNSLASAGCVVSEFPFGTPPAKTNFPIRNRLISGLSLGVLVVEATARSGSLITVRYALEQGKEIFAVPGNITSVTSDGTNDLIRQGAKPVRTAADVIEELSSQIKGLMRPAKTQQPGQSKPGLLEINDEEKAICNILAEGAKHIDHLSRELGIPPARISGLLLGLEMKGIIGQTEGNNFYIL